MNIDRHNYEEYFLLYIDNELTVEQKKQVDVFVKENSDLEEELVMLQQSRLIPEEVVFDKKHLLLKEENSSSIDLKNYTDWLILYVDNELNKDEKIAVEKFAADHSHVQQELDLFQQTKLHPEKIIFADKETLYRTEKITVIRMQWLRIAAAVLLIVSIGVTVPFILNKKNNNGVAKVEPQKQQVKKEQPANSLKLTSPSNVAVPPLDKGTTKDVGDETANITTNKTSPEEKQQREQPKQNNSQQLAYNSTENTNISTPQHVTEEINDTRPAETKMNDASIAVNNLHKEIINDVTVTNTDPTTPNKINNPTNDGSDYVRNDDNTENKRLRGIFRKATRFIKNTTSINAANDDNRLLIGGMAINLK